MPTRSDAPSDSDSLPADSAVTRAFQFGLGIFTLTALIGLANATRIFGDLSRDTLLTHLHSGTLGWITMGVIGVALWLFGGTGQSTGRNVAISGAITALYVVAFWSGNLPARAVTGALELAVIVGWWAWTVGRAAAEGFGMLSVPKLSVVLGLTTLVIGSTVGVIIQVLLATGIGLPADRDVIGTHASAQVGGYLVLVAAGIAEWRLSGLGRTTPGVIQASLLFGGGLLLVIGVFFGLIPLLGLATLLQSIAIVMVAVRFGRKAVGVPWSASTGLRHVAMAIPFLVVALILQAYLVAAIGQAGGDFTKVPGGLITALDHSMFIGVMTNALFGCVLAVTAQSRSRVWPWADHVIFWGLNIGAAAFIAVLVFVGSSAGAGRFAHPVAYTAPIMGLAVLLGVATLSMRLGAERRAVATTRPAQPSMV
ncbi:MAG: hypothetical protein ABR525_02800 [Candidatus Limnocylindria bacterium]